MAGNTKERILEVSLELFAQSGYLGTSMSDIAKQLGITKGALYKHYRSKQEILDRIVQRMNEMDYARAAEYEMPETEPDGFAEAYLHTPVGKIRAYSEAQFDPLDEGAVCREFPPDADAGAIPRAKAHAAVSGLSGGRAAAVYGGDLPQAGGFGRGSDAAGTGVLRADVSALQRL